MDDLSFLDDSARAAVRDAASVTKDGRPLGSTIDGLLTFSPVVHSDHRGRVFEVFPGESEFWTQPVVYCYAWSVRQNMVKGWGLHAEKVDRYTLLRGEIITVLCDARVDSPTRGVVQKVTLSEQGTRQLRIPTGVWHMNVNIGESEAHLINHPTRAYRHGNPDRLLLPWDTSAIPFDLRSLFPVQMKGSDCCGSE